jgi:hypothetical protein
LLASRLRLSQLSLLTCSGKQPQPAKFLAQLRHQIRMSLHERRLDDRLTLGQSQQAFIDDLSDPLAARICTG